MATRFDDESKEDAYYMKKIEVLANKKLALFARYKQMELHEEEEECQEVSSKKSKGQLLEKFITNELNGSDLRLVIEGELIASDLNRLYMPFNQVETHDFLTADEKQIVNKRKVNQDCPKMGIIVRVLGPTLQMYAKTIELKTIWYTPKSPNYVLTTNWCNFVKDHKDVLKEGAKIQVWSFRRNHQLCFAIVCGDQKLTDVEEIHDGENDVVAA